MLERLTLRGFQRHVKRVIDFDPRLTVLVGPNGSGKSAVLRALKWLCLNQPAGDEFIRIGSKRARVTLKVDGHKISRDKGKGVNTYHLDGHKLAAFGQGKAPAPVADLINVDEFNFQDQLDSPFWFAESPPEVARQFNRVVALDVIDRTLSAVASAVRLHKTRGRVSEERLREARRERKHLAWVPKAAKALESLEAKQSILYERTERLELLRNLLSEKEQRANKQVQFQARLNAASRLLTLSETAQEQRERIDRLGAMLSQAREAKTLAEQIVPDLSKANDLQERISKLEAKHDTLAELVSKANELEQTTCRLRSSTKAAISSLRTKTKDLCPVCGSKVNVTSLPSP